MKEKGGELVKEAIVKEFLIVRKEGKREVERARELFGNSEQFGSI
jgi:hypothetical protein